MHIKSIISFVLHSTCNSGYTFMLTQLLYQLIFICYLKLMCIFTYTDYWMIKQKNN